MGQGRRLGVSASLVDGALVAGDVVVGRDGSVESVGVLPAAAGRIAVPGFVDLQVNGFVGVDLAGGDLDAYRHVAGALAAAGTTAWLPTFPTTSDAVLRASLAVAATAVGSDLGGAAAVGVHLEGPFLSPARRGAHPPAHLRAPDPDLLRGYLAAAPVRLVTLAPELDGAVTLLDLLLAAGVVVSVGHSDATAAEAHAAFDRGARAHTHVWNAHRPIASRDPGPGAVALTRPDVVPMLIADLAHSAPESLLLAVLAAADRYVVVTDAVGGPGVLPDGTLAGSTAPLDQAVRNLVALGRPLEEAVAAVSTRPAALLGDPDRGRLAAGARADVTVLDDDLTVLSTLVAGQPII